MKSVLVYIAALLLSISADGYASDPLAGAGQLTLELQEVPIATALNSIAAQHDLNLVIAGEIFGNVTLRLKDVDLVTALEAILAPNGLNYYFNGDVIIVKPITLDAVGERITKVIRLKYADPFVVAQALEPHKTPKGRIVVLNNPEASANRSKFSPNRLMITDLPTSVSAMIPIIEQLDVRERLISIEVKIIETKVDARSKIGFSWPTQFTTTAGNVISGATPTTTTGSTTTTGTADYLGAYDLDAGRWHWGTLSVHEVQAIFDLLQQDGNSKLVSDPHIITAENYQAEIKVQTVIPIPTVNRFTEGAATQDILTFYDEEVGLTLEVTPRISENDRITLDVFPQVEDIIGYVGPTDNQKPITASRSIRTRISVRSGESAVLGGLLKEDEIETIRRVPLLGRIPLLGKLLFTSRSTEKSTTDLIILITPTIIP